jgi:hypothetical protein
VSNVFVKSLARADAALNDVIKNSRWPGGSIWGLSAGEADVIDISLNYFLLLGCGPRLSFKAAAPGKESPFSFQAAVSALRKPRCFSSANRARRMMSDMLVMS